MNRRKFIEAASGTALAGLVAGCPGNGGNGGGDGGTTTTAGETETAGTGTAGTGTAGTGTAETETAQTGTAGTPMETTAGGGLNLDETIGETPEGIQVTNTQLKRVNQGDAGARLTGVINNTGSQTYEELELQATLFDATDDVLGVYFDNTEEEEMQTLGPGKQWQFSIDFPRADLDQPTRYRIDVDAEIDDSVVDVGTETTTTSSS